MRRGSRAGCAVAAMVLTAVVGTVGAGGERGGTRRGTHGHDRSVLRAGRPDLNHADRLHRDVLPTRHRVQRHRHRPELLDRGGTLTATVTGGPSTYTVAISGMTTSGSIKPTIPAGAVENASSVTNTASTSTDNTVTWNGTAAPPKPKPPGTHITRVTVFPHQGNVGFRFDAAGKHTGFRCALVKGHGTAHFTKCSSPKQYRHLRSASYRFELRAFGPAGTDKTPASERFTIKR